MRGAIALAFAAGSAVWASTGAAQTEGRDPFVFVSDREADGSPANPATLAWYLLPMTIRPTGTTVAGVPLAVINQFREGEAERRPAITIEPWCFANRLSDRSFVSISRVVQSSVDQSFARNPDHRFQVRGRFTFANELTAIVGHYQECAGESGSFIMMIDPAASPPTLVHVDDLPYVSGLQYMRMIDGDLTVSTCFECGDVTGLFYDQRRRRFYWEALGD